ncbi:hypothetical protein [Nafulsella turpanensis]|uniref:hypothetical protein n=1 Tax=Nafulsella turpanensis TaxID=1265690 RepID=UPI000348B927|nr:hypothetical protein [Nafulsella turpanensis]
MSKVLNEMDEGFQALKKITLFTLLGAFLSIGGLVTYLLLQEKEKAAQVYVVTDHGTFSALRKEDRQVSVYEIQNLVRTFMHQMFAHDAGSYAEKVEAGLHLIDKAGGKRIVYDFNKGEVLQNYLRLGTYTSLVVDSVLIDMQQKPVTGRCFARQTIHLGERKKEFPIGIRFSVQESYRSEENPYGLLLQEFDYILYAPGSTGPAGKK